MRRTVAYTLIVAALCASRASAADVVPVGPPTCASGPFAIQVDQLFEKRDSYTVGGREFVPFARQWGGMRSITITQRTHGETQLIVPMTHAGPSASGSGVMTMEADDHIRARTKSCSNKRIFVVTWTLHGALSGQCTLDLTVTRDWTEQPTKRGCTADVFGRFTGHYPPIRESWQASLKAEHGASTKREVGNFAAKDISTLTVIRIAPSQ